MKHTENYYSKLKSKITRYHSVPVRMTKIKKREEIKEGKDLKRMKTKNIICCLMGSQSLHFQKHFVN
jgi:hypothetical protein